ncbi:hypothetical protein AM588_10001897 [Phytophthora nicotianae]|uniref:Transcription factor TFIIIB component B'' Myb domain-containing protein n=1 Tax=Phytophthora nicotianae TaxID=4792 RepID=A0A0W8CXF1_PHYNI|nr:hypothetical protein AM588_10001897 [Phytophthora nicotianae]
MKQRMLRKLDIKPHQSPRRSMMQQIRNQDGPTSPLMLGGKPSEGNKDVPEVHLEAQQARRATTTKPRVTAKKRVPVKRRKTGPTTSVPTKSKSETPQRKSLRRKAKRSTYRETDDSGSSASELDDDRDEDVDPNDLELPEDEMNVYVPARERATMWAKSLLDKDKEGEDKEDEASQAMVVREKKAPTRRKRSTSNASSVSSIVTGIGGGIIPRSKLEELLKKEPSQMTMGELALTVPKGRRMKRHEREEAASDTPLLTDASGEGSNLLNVNALNRVRSFQVGPNFSMMATLFPTRKRKELKSKFKYEEKNHAKLIEIALRASTAPLDSEMVDVISQMVDKEAQRKLEAKKKRKSRSQIGLRGQEDDTASVVSSRVSSPASTPQVHTEEFVETLNDEDLFPPSRRGSFDFSG